MVKNPIIFVVIIVLAVIAFQLDVRSLMGNLFPPAKLVCYRQVVTDDLHQYQKKDPVVDADIAARIPCYNVIENSKLKLKIITSGKHDELVQ